MRKLMMLAVLVLLVTSALVGVAQDGEEAGDVCVADAAEGWTLPQTLTEALALRAALAEVIEQCTPVPTPMPPVTESTVTMYVNSGAGQVNMRRAPRLNADLVAKVAHGEAVESLDEVEGDDFRGSTRWHLVSVEGDEGYIHSLLLSETRPVAVSSTSPATGLSHIEVSWHEGRPPTGTCKDNIQQGRIYLGCGYEDRERVKDHLWGLPCNHPVFDAFGYGPPGEGYFLGISATGKHFRWRDDERAGTQCALHP
ncbi:MAG: SH3 domain-containing protein [Anaerolineae bacterium]|nr:SH3 domain-containing protein [Anaerolineae bacterium]